MRGVCIQWTIGLAMHRIPRLMYQLTQELQDQHHIQSRDIPYSTFTLQSSRYISLIIMGSQTVMQYKHCNVPISISKSISQCGTSSLSDSVVYREWRTHKVVSVNDVDCVSVDSDIDRVIKFDRQQTVTRMFHLATEICTTDIQHTVSNDNSL